jgi:hypothetical protein
MEPPIYIQRENKEHTHKQTWLNIWRVSRNEMGLHIRRLFQLKSQSDLTTLTVYGGGIAQGVPYADTNTDLLWFPIWVLMTPDSSTRALWQWPADKPGSDAGRELGEKCRWIYPTSISFHTVRICNMPWHLTTWNRRLYFPSEGCSATDFIAINSPSSSAWLEIAILWSNGKHANH